MAYILQGMDVNVNVRVSGGVDLRFPASESIRDQLDRIEGKVSNIMATVAELESELVGINETTNAMADALTDVSHDVDDLIAKVQASDVTGALATAQAIKENLGAKVAELSEIASRHDSSAPVPDPEPEPGPDDGGPVSRRR